MLILTMKFGINQIHEMEEAPYYLMGMGPGATQPTHLPCPAVQVILLLKLRDILVPLVLR
jgi:hypothetical protein